MAEEAKTPKPVQPRKVDSSTKIEPKVKACIVYMNYHLASGQDISTLIKEKYNLDIPSEAIRRYCDKIKEHVMNAGHNWYDPVAPASVIASHVKDECSFDDVREFNPKDPKVFSNGFTFLICIG